MKQSLLPIFILSLATASSAFDGTYFGKISSVGCNATNNVCWVTLNEVFANAALPACSNNSSKQVRWYGKTANGAVMTAMLTKAFLKNLTIELGVDISACFEGDPAYPKGLFFNIVDPVNG